MPKPDHRSQMARACLHFHAARRDVEAGVRPRVSTGQSIHAVPSITPSPREGIEDGPRLRADPLGLSNWQMIQKTAFKMRSKGTFGADDGSELRRAGRGFRSVIPVTPSHGELRFNAQMRWAAGERRRIWRCGDVAKSRKFGPLR
jgi:hypothetical protein